MFTFLIESPGMRHDLVKGWNDFDVVSKFTDARKIRMGVYQDLCRSCNSSKGNRIDG